MGGYGSDNPESRVAKQYRWDAQGRRHKKDGVTPRGNFYEEAMKVRTQLQNTMIQKTRGTLASLLTACAVLPCSLSILPFTCGTCR